MPTKSPVCDETQTALNFNLDVWESHELKLAKQNSRNAYTDFGVLESKINNAAADCRRAKALLKAFPSKFNERNLASEEAFYGIICVRYEAARDRLKTARNALNFMLENV